jgi:hypothetical protein
MLLNGSEKTKIPKPSWTKQPLSASLSACEISLCSKTVPPFLVLSMVPTSKSLNCSSWSSQLLALSRQFNVAAAAATSTAADPTSQGATKSSASTATAASTATNPTSQGTTKSSAVDPPIPPGHCDSPEAGKGQLGNKFRTCAHANANAVPAAMPPCVRDLSSLR